ncbi:MFS transporter [Catelliglobosispora koreensis]|uniref:MFS transporter n=1 Tax=Catelliglobosispora koreensis TaxID=129052 RepID=UPI00035C631F|nr:MFS transporter [Catelliglobosispora koreensis]
MPISVDTRPLRIAPFRRLWLASVVTAVGGQFSFIAVPKQLYDLTGSSRYIGIAGAVTLCCLGVAALWGGALADVYDRRRVLLVTSSGIAATAVLFWALYAVATVPVMLTLIGLNAMFMGAHLSAFGAAIPRLVPTELLTAASSLGSLVRSLGPIAGPLLAVLLIPLTGLQWLYAVDAIALTATVWAVWRLPAMPPGTQAKRRINVVDGLRYLAAQPVLVALLAADLIAMVFGLPVALYPELAEHRFGGDRALGLLFAGLPIGIFAMGLISGRFTHFKRHGVIVTVAVAAWGATLVGLGLSYTLPFAMAFLIVGGAANFLLTTFRNAMTQAYATDEMRGRTQGALTLITMGGPSLANLLHGTLSPAIGPSWTIAGGGLLTMAAVIAVAIAVPSFWAYSSR